MSFQIRRATHEDAEAIIHVHVNSIRTLCANDYTVEQVEAWTGRNFKPELWKQAIDRDFIWVVQSGKDVLGFGHFAVMDEENGEVLGLYFIPPAIGQGLGKKMFAEFVRIANQHHLKRITLHSTITAKKFYEHLGLRQYDSDTTVDMRGVAIPCFPMEIDL